VADLVLEAYEEYSAAYREITRRAGRHFAARDWRGTQENARARLGLYAMRVNHVVGRIRELHSDLGTFPGYTVRTEFGERIQGRRDPELAATFFNSVARRIHSTVGIDPATEFVGEGLPRPRVEPPAYHVVTPKGDVAQALRTVLTVLKPDGPYRDLEADLALLVPRAEAAIPELRLPDAKIEMLPSVFYRNKGAYLVGRVRTDPKAVPLVIAVTHPPAGITVDALLTTSDEASIVFGFTRSYFHADTECPRATVGFLQSIMPGKRLDELYTAIGYHKHGKTELYRALTQHLKLPYARFEPAPGDRGLVMVAFTLPSFNTVFKIIRDRFAPPKRITRREVEEKYRLVFELDRAGRLADAQEFGGVELPRRCFTPELLDELATEAADSVAIDQHRVVVRHLYTERRVTPLNLFFRDAPLAAAQAAAVEYGTAIKDLARVNIFPGDMLSKNFGVTRHGRVVFYDYDELCLLTECRFRAIPTPRTDDEAYSAEPWFPVGERDVFPEEFGPFLLPPPPVRQAFLEAHADLLTVEYWQRIQQRVATGEIIDLFPYPEERRLRPSAER
jgi:isocitrate dehydrogenase kinase/phosphatase